MQNITKGLTSIQAERFLTQYGFNTILEPSKKNFFIKFFEQFNDFLIFLLLGAATVSFLIKEPVDGSLILIVVILNAFFGLYQEGKAEESLVALKKMTVTKVRVIRDGKQSEIESRYLVPGDLIIIEEGSKVAADGEVLESVNLEINEAALTGESLPTAKMPGETVYSGTVVSRGRGILKITLTGMDTKFGQIAKNLTAVEDSETPLQKKLANLSKLIGIIGITISLAVFFICLIEGVGYFPAFLLSVSLAVAIVPESLAAVMTITLAIGMKKMADKKAIVRRLSAIEALGSITLIATDKTGTLTENKMKVKEVFVDNHIINIDSSSEILSRLNSSLTLVKQKVSKIFSYSSLDYLLLNCILCSTASLVYIHDHGSWDVLGDPTEGALLYLAQEAGINIEEVRSNWQLIEEKPFDSVTKMMSVVVMGPGARLSPASARDQRQAGKIAARLQEPSNSRHPQSFYTFSKGAPESILNVCDNIIVNGKEEKMTGEKKKVIENQVNKWASKGLRVLAFAYRSHSGRASSPAKRDRSLTRMTFLGLVAIHDAPRPQVREAVEKARRAGIKVVMITGDNEKTAEVIGVSSGLIQEDDEILTGVQIEEYSDKELLKILPKVRIFARTNPFQKYRIVKLYQTLGEVVAVTGDGVNDAIALKQADVGVAMGQVGTDVVREVADIVITDDNFATIVTAIDEGRNIINHLKNAIKYLLSCNVSEALSLMIGLILGLPTIFYPVQLLYINLVTDGLPALMLAFSPRDPNLMSISPQKEMVLIKKKDQLYIVLIGIVGSLIVISSYFIYQHSGLGKTAAFSVLTLIQSFVFIDLWLSHRALHKHIYHLISPLFVLGFAIPVVLQFIILSQSFTARLFKINPVSAFIYFQLLLISSMVLLGIKIVKKFI